MSTDFIDMLPKPASREVITIRVPRHEHQLELTIEDGLRLQMRYGNTQVDIDLPTNHSFTSPIDDSAPMSITPTLWLAYIGADQLAKINAECHRLVYGDTDAPTPHAPL